MVHGSLKAFTTNYPQITQITQIQKDSKAESKPTETFKTSKLST
jgi:hypothetical protein